MNATSQENDFVILQIVRYRLSNRIGRFHTVFGFIPNYSTGKVWHRLFYTSDLFFFRGRFQHEVLEIPKTADKITMAGLTKDPKSWEVWLFASARANFRATSVDELTDIYWERYTQIGQAVLKFLDLVFVKRHLAEYQALVCSTGASEEEIVQVDIEEFDEENDGGPKQVVAPTSNSRLLAVWFLSLERYLKSIPPTSTLR